MRVVASDMDDPLTLNGAIRYHIVLQVPMMTAHRVFTIDRFTGIITNTVRLDRERVAHFSLVVMASDMEGDANIGLSTTATAIVTITDINDIAPEFTRRTWFGTVRENAVGVPVTMPPLSVIDSDEAGTAAWGGGEWGAGDPGDLFVVETDPGTNNGRIVVVKPLDFETSSSYQLIVFVDNEEPLMKTMRPPPESTATVTVSVEDENEAPLFEPRLQQVMLAEGLALGSAVTTLVARDPDTAQKQSLRYRKLRVPGDWLDIDAAGGAVSTAAELDRESPLVQRNVYTATFLATDDGSPRRERYRHAGVAAERRQRQRPHGRRVAAWGRRVPPHRRRRRRLGRRRGPQRPPLPLPAGARRRRRRRLDAPPGRRQQLAAAGQVVAGGGAPLGGAARRGLGHAAAERRAAAAGGALRRVRPPRPLPPRQRRQRSRQRRLGHGDLTGRSRLPSLGVETASPWRQSGQVEPRGAARRRGH
ncbi:cadherin-2-like [Petromyzon marinus]|uniref:cadherin-2-like n=1 Tax=Petromyzon marinus TaxID=7757 RepID=UPI003F6F2455